MGVLPDVSYSQYNMVYNALSMGIAAMGAASIFVFLQVPNVVKRFRTALLINALVTFIATYHYFRIFNSWDAAYTISESEAVAGTVTTYTVAKSGKSFNDAYRYVDWLLTVPLLLIELILVMDLPAAKTRTLAWQLGLASALMVAIGYPGEVADEANTRWICFGLAIIPFIFVLYNLLVGLAPKSVEGLEDEEEEDEEDPALGAASVYSNENVQSLIAYARYLTAISWLTYPFVFCVKAMPNATGAQIMALEQVGYSIADIVAKAVFGILIWAIASTKSDLEEAAAKA